ncbi:hypothetical protein [Spirosoma sp. KNUC1025]|uniref:hypothetical protein n=1 Tax=Spirosoma sp. KNUC1025 TaxID=2894082 RepID=UPI003865D50D|nr:hypothetical protein LN737_13340 [Spirosoma sp. KNUC1025]
MKKSTSIILILALLLAPLAFRYSFPDVYQKILQTYPVMGLGLIVALDILWMWIILAILVLSARLVRWIRSRE